MAVIYEVKIKAGTYTKDGQEKVRYQHIGNVIDTKKGQMLKLDQVPLIDGGWNGWAYLFEPRTDEQRQATQKNKSDEFGQIDDSIPF